MVRAAAWIIVLGQFAAAQEWPQFRGPDGQGHSDVKGLPLKWSDGAENIKWKVPIDGLGWSSPVVADGKLWLTTATDAGKSLRVISFDAATGKELKNVEVFRVEAPPRIHDKNSHASPTPIVEKDHVYVHFGTNGTACLTTEGKPVWKQSIKYSMVHGSGGSPALVGDLLIFSCDGVDTQAVIALDKKSGAIRWKTPRETLQIPKKFAFSTPLAIDVKGARQVVSPGAGAVSGYDPASGRPVWTVKYGTGYSNVPRPVFGHGLVFVSSGFDSPTLLAIKPDGRGDVTETHIAWRMTKGAPLSPSPILVGDELFMVDDRGLGTCVDAATGKVHWQERIGGNFSASPVHAAGQIYFLDENGGMTVVKADKTFMKLSKNDLKGRTLASPVPIEGALFLRTDTQLFRIEAEAK
jgi:outer membrane protein assembly factor BamB